MSSDAEQTLDTAKLHSWDVYTITGRYLSMDFIMSDAKGNAIHSTAKANVAHNFLRLKEDSVYSIKNFVVQANKEEYRIFKDHAYMIEFDGAMSVRNTSVKGALLLTLDSAIRMTLRRGLGDALVEKKINNVGLYPMVLISMNVKLYYNKLYLSSGSSTHILDDPQIPALRAENRLLYMSTTLRLRKARWKTYSSRLGTERMLVKINDIRTMMGWNFPSCGGDKCKKCVVRKEGSFWCEACNRAFKFPVLRLELDVSHKTASTVLVMFNEPAIELVKCSIDSLAKADDDVGLAYVDDSFTCSRIAPEEVVEEDVGSSNVGASAEVNTKELKRLATKPSVATSSKPAEEQGKKVDLEDSDEEVTCGMDDGQADATDSSVLNKRKKKRYIVDDSASE
ncbi:reverse transcriptase domain-containing protein [Tanacetum coccineum]